MKLKILGSNSSGNGYVLTDEKGYSLILECGVPLKDIKVHLNFRMEGIVGALLSHSHGDHAKYVKQYLDAGIDIYSGEETLKALGIYDHHRAYPVEHGLRVSMFPMPYSFKPFSMKHDVPCLGFIIQHKEMGKLVFMTDSFYSPYKFAEVNHFLVEANHDEEVLGERIKDGDINPSLGQRIMTSHMSIQTAMKMILANDLKHTRNIILTHLSDSNSHEGRFYEKALLDTGKSIYIANSGLEVDLNLTPF